MLPRYCDQEYSYREAHHFGDHVMPFCPRFLQVSHHPRQQLSGEFFWIRGHDSFLQSPQLSKYFSQLSSSHVPLHNLNSGLQDQRAALEFVQDNISKFGGDPEKVGLRSLSEECYS